MIMWNWVLWLAVQQGSNSAFEGTAQIFILCDKGKTVFGKSWGALAWPPHLCGQQPMGQSWATHPALHGKWKKPSWKQALGHNRFGNKHHFWSTVQMIFSPSQLVIKPVSCEQLSGCYRRVILLLKYFCGGATRCGIASTSWGRSHRACFPVWEGGGW